MSQIAPYCWLSCTTTEPACEAYRGQRAVIRQHAPRARDLVNRRYLHRRCLNEVERAKKPTKSEVRARVEHSIGVIKRVFALPRWALAG